MNRICRLGLGTCPKDSFGRDEDFDVRQEVSSQ
jgi:hypothetical protein